MARSAEALQRRALKRNRSVEEQQKVEVTVAQKQQKKKKIAKAYNGETTTKAGWTCPACQTENTASRYVCLSKTCQQAKPEPKVAVKDNSNGTIKKTAPTPTITPNKKPKNRHDPDTSKAVDWSKPQATPEQLQANQELRERFQAQDPTLTDEERERARILIARDERKKQKKSSKKSGVATGTSAPLTVDNTGTDKKQEELSTKEQHKANKLLLKRYKKTNGIGMTEAEVTRVNQLLERKLRKLQKQLEEKKEQKKQQPQAQDEKSDSTEEDDTNEASKASDKSQLDHEDNASTSNEEEEKAARKKGRKDKKKAKKERKEKQKGRDDTAKEAN